MQALIKCPYGHKAPTAMVQDRAGTHFICGECKRVFTVKMQAQQLYGNDQITHVTTTTTVYEEATLENRGYALWHGNQLEICYEMDAEELSRG